MIEPRSIRQQIEKVLELFDSLKVVWLTTFNLSPIFVEKNLLSLFGRGDPDAHPTNLREYEEFHQQLRRAGTDFRCFHDYRVVNVGEGKKTAIPFHAVDPILLDGRFSDRSLFHPKVMFLYGTDFHSRPLAFVGVGSANLTLSGWGANQECFVLLPLGDRDNAQRVLDFFRPLTKEGQFGVACGELRADWADHLPSSYPGWRFLSTLNDTPSGPEFFDALAGPGETIKSLTVWSPYFPEDLAEWLAGQPFSDRVDSLTLVPDLTVGGQPRILSSNTDGLKSNGKVRFCRAQQFDPEQEATHRFVHAKVWLTDSRIAIGSWNFSRSAMYGVNVEAGIIFDTNRKLQRALTKQLLPLDPKFMDSDPDREALSDRLNQETVTIEVIADWKRRRYVLEGELGAGHRLLLPGITEPQLPDQVCGQEIFRESAKHLVRKRIFQILRPRAQARETGFETVGTGFIIEINCDGRPAWRHGSLNDCLLSWVGGDPENRRDLHTPTSAEPPTQDPNTPPGEKPESDEEEEDRYIADGDGRFANWYDLFSALAKIRRRFDEANQDPDKLRQLGHVQPGNLVELTELANNAFSSSPPADGTKADTPYRASSNAYRWFLAEELQRLLAAFNASVQDSGLKISTEVKTTSPVPADADPRKWKQLLALIRADMDEDWR